MNFNKRVSDCKKMLINIDLSAFFKDERKFVCVMVDPTWETVESLQKRVEYLYKLDSIGFLYGNGHVSPQESIRIIQFCEKLTAFVLNESLERRSNKKSKKSKCLEKSPQISESEKNPINIEDVQEHDDHKKKRKYFSLDGSHAAGTDLSHAKRIKNSNQINENLSPNQLEHKCMEITSTSEQIHPSTIQTKHTVPANSSKKTKGKHLQNCEVSDIENDHQSQSSLVIAENAKSSEQEIEKEFGDRGESIIINTKSSAQSTSIPSSTFLNESKIRVIAQKHSKNNTSNSNNSFRKKLSSKAHIYFNESGEVVNTTDTSQSKTDKESKTVVIFRCPLQEITQKEETPNPRIFCFTRKISYNKKKKQPVEINESIVLPPIPNLDFEKKNSLVKENTENKSLLKENVASNLEHEQNNTKISEIDLLKEKTILSDISTPAENATITKNIDVTLDNCIEQSNIENNTEMIISEQNSVSKLQSIDCVDLSIESEKCDVTETKLKTSKKKHGITNDENTNDSSSDVEEISEIIDLNETEDSAACSLPLNDIKVDKILPFCTDISDLPNINDIMVFKMAYANTKQHQKETNFFAGKVEYINKRTKSIKVLIIDGLAEMAYINSKFILNLRDSQDVIEYLQVKMSDLIEPKIFSTC